MAIGTVRVLPSSLAARTARTIPSSAVPAERERLASAAATAAAELETLRRSIASDGRASEAEIFHAQAIMATDPALLDAANAIVGDRHVDAATACVDAAASVAASLRALPDQTLAARAADVVDVADRIAGILDGRPAPSALLATPAIVAAAELAPSLVASLPRSNMLAVVLEEGAPTAHAAILARAYGIPAIVRASGALAILADGARAAVDGTTGEIFAHPTDADLAMLRERQDRFARTRREALAHAHDPATTRDGARITLLANIGGPHDVESALAWGADGVGLLRTEFLFLERAAPPDEDEQERVYRSIIAAFAPRPVTVRLLDVGGDKDIPYLGLAREANPFLGVRALRLVTRDRTLFLTQLRALARASDAGDLKIMAAMVADLEDARLLATLWREALQVAPSAKARLGVMIEIPSAALLADQLFDEVDFASLGTNDLLQYTVAADRGEAALARYHDPLHPALLRLVAASVAAADRAGKELSVCGEMAGDPLCAAVLVGLGIRELSMTSTSLAAVRSAIRASSLVDLRALAGGAVARASAAEVRELARTALGSGQTAAARP